MFTNLLDRVRPDLCGKVEQQQAYQKQHFDERAKQRPISEGDMVFAKDSSNEGRWKPATVTTERGGPNSSAFSRTAGQHTDTLSSCGSQRLLEALLSLLRRKQARVRLLARGRWLNRNDVYASYALGQGDRYCQRFLKRVEKLM